MPAKPTWSSSPSLHVSRRSAPSSSPLPARTRQAAGSPLTLARKARGSTAGQQQSRVFVAGPDQALYMLFVKGIVQVDCATHALTLIGESPVPIGPGGTYLEGRIYFGSGSHVYSFTLPE